MNEGRTRYVVAAVVALVGLIFIVQGLGVDIAHSIMTGDLRWTAVGIVMAPHWSGMSVETYVDRVEKTLADEGGPSFTFVRSFHDHPAFVSFLAGRLDEALASLSPAHRDGAAV